MSKMKSWMLGFLVSATFVPTWVMSNNLGLVPANTPGNGGAVNFTITMPNQVEQRPLTPSEPIAIQAPQAPKPLISPKAQLQIVEPRRQDDGKYDIGQEVDEDEVATPGEHDMTGDELQKYSLNTTYTVFPNPNPTSLKVTIRTYKPCASKLSSPNERNGVYSEKHGGILFRIRDDGYIKCMKEFEGRGNGGGWPKCDRDFGQNGKHDFQSICTDVTKTVSLSGMNIPGNVEKVGVFLAWRESGCADFSSCIAGVYNVKEDVVTADMKTAQARVAENHKLESSLRAMLAGTTAPNERKFTEASERLRSESAIDEEVLTKWERDFAKILRDDEEKKAREQIAELSREGANSTSVDGITADLIAIARAHPERTKDVAAALKEIARAQAELRDDESGNVIGNPTAVLDRLKDINEYNSEARKLAREFRLAKYDGYTPENYRDLSRLNKDLRPLEKDIMKNIRVACNQNRRGDASLEACAMAQDDYQKIQQIKIGAYQNLAAGAQGGFGGSGMNGMNGMMMGGGFGGGFGGGVGFNPYLTGLSSMGPMGYGYGGMPMYGMGMSPGIGIGIGFGGGFGGGYGGMPMYGMGSGYNPMMMGYGGGVGMSPYMNPYTTPMTGVGGGFGYGGFGGGFGGGYGGMGGMGYGGGFPVMFPSTFGPQGYGV